MRYCKRCVYPEIAVNLLVDDEGVCSACRVHDEVDHIPESQWARRKDLFVRLLEQGRKGREGDYDCVVGVSGGKDSYFQVDVVKSLGFKPLLVTYHGNNYLPEGQGNLDRMRHVTGCDHLVLGPSVDTLVRLNRHAFYKMGDMNWHNHAGIFMTPMRIAIQWKIPFVVWGETAWDLAGMYSPDDDFERSGVRGIYVGNFFRWDANEHVKLVTQKYGFEAARQPFERTYRTFSNLDDMHENGIHDYLKFVKFGYGRGSDHASKDIRGKYMSRAEGIEAVRRYDHVKPMRDLHRWLEYVGMDEAEFDRVADTFRDKRVWTQDASGAWRKDNIWDFEAREAAAHAP